jgi:uncharacterized RDD family membrane protein YckC
VLLLASLGPAQAPTEAGLVRPDNAVASRTDPLRHEVLMGIGKDVTLPEGAEAEVVVALFGNIKAAGNVRDTVVAVGGDVELSGTVRGEVVAVGGAVLLRPDAVVEGDVVSVGGTITLEPGARANGQLHGIQWGGPGLGGLTTWVRECVLKLRPLSFAVGWVWVALGIMAFFYLLVTLLFPRAIHACANAVENRPASTLLLGLLAKLLVPFGIFLLALTGLGLLLVPILLLVVLLAGLVGKVGFLVYLGRLLVRGNAQRFSLLGSLLVGFALMTLLYLVPLVGLLAFVVTGLWGLGAAVVALWGGLRQEITPHSTSGPLQPGSTPPMSGPQPVPPMPVQPLSSVSPTGVPGPTPEFGTPGTPPDIAGVVPPSRPGQPGAASATPATPVQTQPPRYGEWALPRAGLGERFAAALIDAVIVVLLMALVAGPPVGWLLALLYFAGFWTWRGTTVGGVILRLKVVRLDGQPLRLEVAVVRALGAVVSVVALFLGFLWIAWDPERQGWHDKLVGTVVVRLPQSPPLLCL